MIRERGHRWPVGDAVAIAGPAALVVSVALVVAHVAAGVREFSEPPLLEHVARDAGLAVVLAVAALTVVLRLGAFRTARARALTAMATVGGAMAVGVVAHGWLFPAQAHVHASAAHDINEALLAAVGGAAAAWLTATRITLPAIGRHVMTALAVTIAMFGSVAAVGGGVANADKVQPNASSASSNDRFLDPAFQEGELADITQPCVAKSPLAAPFTAEMPIPPALRPISTPSSDAYDITEQATTTEIIPGIRTKAWGYNGLVPGPTILARKGRPALVTFHNRLPLNDDAKNIEMDPPLDPRDHPFIPSSTVVHLHGINDEPISDGYPEFRRVPPGQPPAPSGPATPSDQTHHYDNDDFQTPATLWYHDHSLHITSEHIYRGLAGMYILQDDAEDALPLPEGYGVKDIPLVLKDLMIDPANGKLLYNNCSHHGAYGDVMTMNGKQQPRFDVATTKYRFRMLNGSDARQYVVALRPADRIDDVHADQPFVVLGSDQGLLENPQPVTEFHISPSERVEFGVDFSKYPVGTRLVMVNELVDTDQAWFPLMAFDVTRAETDNSQFVGRFLDNERPPVKTVTFHFNRSGGYFSINSLQWDPNRDDDKPLVNTAEDWVIINDSGGWGHPIHVHLGRFKVLEIDGRPPLPGEGGWKDVVWLGPNQRIKVRPIFANFTGRYVFHCHNGSHEDHDMMSQFNVQPG